MLLKIQNLSVEYYRRKKVIPAVKDVSLELAESETLGIVGESGCGKSTLALAVMRLISPNEGKIVQGEMFFQDRDLLKLSDDKTRQIRGKEISMIFQDPFTSLNPVVTIGNQIGEAINVHQVSSLPSKLLREKVINLLEQVRLSNPEQVYNSYPHQLSGGMQQRCMIAMAVSSNPKILIADEPTTALDVTIQKEILKLLGALKSKLNMSIIFITHNLGIIIENANRVIVMYAGKIVEESSVKELFTNPLHPYTQGLLRSLPKLNEKPNRLNSIPGQIPDLLNLPPGCKFNPRCEKRMEICTQKEPELLIKNNGNVRCFLYA